VWQQAWTPAVREAVAGVDPSVAPPVILAAVVQWESTGQPRVVSVPIDISALGGRPYAVAIRIGTTTPGAANAVHVVGAARKVLGDLPRPPVELQIDFDCPESKLDGYLTWINAIQQAVKPVPVAITALPAWLDRRAFATLARQCPYVLQVHSPQKPTTAGGEWRIIDPAAARRAVERAAKIGVPFRVALPTFGYAVVGNPKGAYVVYAESMTPDDLPAAVTRWVRTDPGEMADLIRQWQADRPAMMTGVIWFRLPIATDVMNWRPATFAAVRAGRKPAAAVKVVATADASGLVELSLINEGDADAPLPSGVTLEWTGAAPIASDFVGGYARLDDQPTSVTLRRSGPGNDPASVGDPASLLAAGDRRAIGWLRFTKDTEVRGHVTSSP